MENKNKKKRIIIIVICSLLLVTGLVVFLMTTKFFSQDKKETKKEETKENKRRETKQAESPVLNPIVVEDLFKIECTNKVKKEYSGYAIGDTMLCTLNFKIVESDFEDENSILYSFLASATTSNNVEIESMEATGVENDRLFEDFKVEKLHNYIKLENARDYSPHMTCSNPKKTCINTNLVGRTEKSLKANINEYYFFDDSVQNVEVHMELYVNTNLAENPIISISFNSLEFSVYNPLNHQIQPYITAAFYSYDTNNNTKYVVRDDKVLEFTRGKYVESYKIPCKTTICRGVANEEINKIGLVRVFDGGTDSVNYSIWIYDLNNKQEYRNYKNAKYVFHDGVYYLIGNTPDNPEHYTITDITEDNDLLEFTESELYYFDGASFTDGMIELYFYNPDEPTKMYSRKYDIANNTITDELELKWG